MKATRLVPLFVSLLSCRSVVAEYEPIDVSRVRDKVSTQLHQNFAIVFDQRGNRLVNPSRINTARKESVIMGEFLDHKGLRMLIQSTFPKVVRYHAAARGEGQTRLASPQQNVWTATQGRYLQRLPRPD